MMSPDEEDVLQRRVMRKISWKTLPYVYFVYLFTQLLRTNINNAHNTMAKDLDFTQQQYAWEVSVFFGAYVIFQIPSNLIMKKIAPNRWLGGLMIMWSLFSTALCISNSFTSMTVLRVLMGVFQAGMFAGILYYLTLWFPLEERSSKFAIVHLAGSSASVVSGVLAYGILQMEGILGWHGWQWLFFLEGIPSIVVGFVVVWKLPNPPQYGDKYAWMTIDEQRYFQSIFHRSVSRAEVMNRAVKDDYASSVRVLLRLLRDWRIYAFAIVFLSSLTGQNGVGYFQTNILLDDGFSEGIANLITSPLGLVSAIAVVSYSNLAQRFNKVPHFTTIGIFFVTLIYVFFTWTTTRPERWLHMVGAFTASSLTGIWNPPFFAFVTSTLSRQTSAFGIAFVVSFGNLGGIIGPNLMSFSVTRWGSYLYAYLAMSMFYCLAFALCAAVFIFNIVNIPIATPSETSPILNNKKINV